MYRIIFRTCDKVSAVNRLARPFGLDKRGIIQLAFQSLHAAVAGFPHRIQVIADDISDETRNFFRQYPVEMTEGTFGNDNSIRASLAEATRCDDEDWVYLVEDDYLHTPDAFRRIDELIEHRDDILLTTPRNRLARLLLGELRRRPSRHHLVIHPPDYPDRYWPEDRRPSYLFAAPSGHWRQVVNTTFTVLAQARTFKHFAAAFEKAATGADDGLLSRKVYGRDVFLGRALCVSPIPGVATHMHEGVMTPVVDWTEIRHRLAEREALKSSRQG